MLALTLLWIFWLIFTIGQVILTSIQNTVVSPLLPVFIALALLPLWVYMIDYIRSTWDIHGSRAFFMKWVLVLIFSWGILWFHPTLLGWLILMLWACALVWFIDARILFLGALLFLCFLPILLIVEEKSQAEIFSVYLYYCLVVGVWTEIVWGFIRKYVERWLGFIQTPKIVTEYLGEMRYFSLLFIHIAPFLFIVCFIFLLSQDISWIFSIRDSLLAWIVLLLYISLLLTPIHPREIFFIMNRKRVHPEE